MKRESRPRCPYCHYSMVAVYTQRGAQISGGKHRIEKVGWYCPQDREIFTLGDFDRGRYIGSMNQALRERVEDASLPEKLTPGEALKKTTVRTAQKPQMTSRDEPPIVSPSEVEEMPSATNKRGSFIIYDGSDDEETLMEKFGLKELEAKVVLMFMAGMPFDEIGKRIKKSSEWTQHFVAIARKKMEKKGVILPARHEAAGWRKEEL